MAKQRNLKQQLADALEREAVLRAKVVFAKETAKSFLAMKHGYPTEEMGLIAGFEV